MPQKGVIAYYITAHGYGHGVRSCDVIRALILLKPELPIIVVSDLPVPFFRSRLPEGKYTLRPGSFDAGMVQLDSIRVDLNASLGEVESLLARWDRLTEQERRFLRDNGVGVVVVDIPGIPIVAAAALGIPAVAIGNFGWDWIYGAYVAEDPRWQSAVEAYRKTYAKADLLLRLPFAEGMTVFPRREDIAIVASPGRNRRFELAALFRCPPETRWILLSFTTLEWDEAALEAVEALSDYQFFTVLPLQWNRRNIHGVDRDRIPFPDVVASVDCVLSKPGFGIMSECTVNRKPLIYADRSDFIEYLLLEKEIRKYLRNVHIPCEKLYRGDLREALDAVWHSPEPEASLRAGGAPVAAQRILHFLDADCGLRNAD